MSWSTSADIERTDSAGSPYEYRVITLPPSTDTSTARRLLTDEAEYGRWELARSVIYVGGRRTVWLRRRIMRVRRTI